MTKSELIEVLKQVKDPEIPTVSLVDLGVIEVIEFSEERVRIELVPTFAACPAMELMRLEVIEVLKQAGYSLSNIEVFINKLKGWSSNRLTPEGIEGLKKFGISPPHPVKSWEEVPTQPAQCPKCGSLNTQMVSPFGPTLCRVIHKCLNCHETFEQFKSV